MSELDLRRKPCTDVNAIDAAKQRRTRSGRGIEK